MNKQTRACALLGLLWAAPVFAQKEKTWTLDGEFDTGVLDSVNHDAPNNNQLQLSATSSTEPYIWVANFNIGTVTKINTETGKQEARYDSVLTKNWDGTVPTVRPPRETKTDGPDKGSNCNSPSRTAVDGSGNAFVANRSICAGNYATVTKIAGSIFSCVDRNGNGVIDTSSDVNHNGIIEMNDPREFLGQNDECLLWTKNYTEQSDDWGRSAAVDADQNLWVGGYHTATLYKLDGNTGARLKKIDTRAQISPTKNYIYGIAIGPGGFIYTSDIGAGLLLKIDTNAAAGKEVVKVLQSPVPTYGTAVDKNGVAWFGNWSADRANVVRADFNADAVTLHGAGLGGCGGWTRGVAVDKNGDIWVSCYRDSKLLHFNSAGTLLESWPVGAGPVGAAVDGKGKIWTVNWDSVTATRYDPLKSSAQTFPAGEPAFGDRDIPYSYSDMTGFQQRNFTQRQGDWTVQHDSAHAGTTWGAISWNREPQGKVPAGTSITVEARAADTLAALALKPLIPVSNGQPTTGLVGRFIEIKPTLRIQSGNVSPVLSDLSVVYTPPCIEVRLSDYNLFVLQDYTGGHDVQGKVAAGGALSMTGFAVGSGLPNNDIAQAVVAGGNLSLSQGGVWGDAWYGGTFTRDPSVTFTRGKASKGTPINFAARGAELRGMSTRLASLTKNGSTRLESWGGIMLKGTDPKVNVFQVNASAFSTAKLLSIDAPAGSLVVVNITGASATFTGFGIQFSGGIDQHGVLYNFVDTATIDAHGFGFWGTVLAPYARINFSDGSWDGGIYALSLTGSAEGHVNALQDRDICP